ncbi:MAG: hypothetical protein LQ343_005424 [Gyalolechia ehrenbergii]|nr:MAG: hypothetical protein LQ343_005424 [Gyalolechia ehrenbergii]
MNGETDYSQWSPGKLIKRVTSLEAQLREQTIRYDQLLHKARAPVPPPKLSRPKAIRQFDPSKYSTRFIALKFAYLGQQYNGLEYHANNTTPYPTIEEELWRALYKAKLISPTPNPSLKEGEPNWEGCDYSKCGRTDKGVSAFGQVISIRVRSNRPLVTTECEGALEEEEGDLEGDEPVQLASTRMHFDPIKDEIPYPQILNRLLPSKIRILAWCPFPPKDFSARFTCTERCYKYFFTQPAFAPTIGTGGLLHTKESQGRQREGWLDIQAMREAVRKFEGSHDFRNFCKVDPSKQIDSFVRLVSSAEIAEVKTGEGGPMGYLELPDFRQYHQPQTEPIEPELQSEACDKAASPLVHSIPKLYAFEVKGSGFLWHQVRHMVAILFLIGQGLENPSLVEDLLDIKKTPQKPVYDMADAAPLVLEDCQFGSGLQWITLDDSSRTGTSVFRTGDKSDGKHGIGGAVDELWKVWHRHKIDEILASSLLDLTVRGHKSNVRCYNEVSQGNKDEGPQDKARKSESQKIFLGGDSSRYGGKYTSVLGRPRMETIDAINAKYLKRKGIGPPERNRVKIMSPEK